jgi:ComF family protein
MGLLLGHVLPLRCLACPELTLGSEFSPFLCARCADEMHAPGGRRWAVDGTVVVGAFRYAGVARVLVRELKFRGATGVAAPLGAALGAALADLPAGPIGIVPVPLHWRRRWQRGHNQSAALARVVAAARPGFRLLAALRKTRATPPQVGLDGSRRRHNVRGTFAIPRRYARRVRGARLVVVDDVATTAATLRSAGDCLVAAGAAEVTLAAVAVATENVRIAARRPSGLAGG